MNISVPLNPSFYNPIKKGSQNNEWYTIQFFDIARHMVVKITAIHNL